MSENALPTPHPLDVSLFSKRGNKTTKLINSANDLAHVTGQHRWYEFNFEVPVFIQDILIKTSGYSNFNEIEVELFCLDGSRHRDLVRVTDGNSFAGVGRVAKGFRFRPPSKFLSETKIISVRVVGLTLEELRDFESEIIQLDAREAKVSERERKMAESEASFSELKEEEKSIQSEVGKLQAQRAEIEEMLLKARAELSASREKIKDVDQEIENRQNELRSVRGEATSAHRTRGTHQRG